MDHYELVATRRLSGDPEMEYATEDIAQRDQRYSRMMGQLKIELNLVEECLREFERLKREAPPSVATVWNAESGFETHAQSDILEQVARALDQLAIEDQNRHAKVNYSNL